MTKPAQALSRLIQALERLGIPHEVGGSVASSLHGIPRTTLDVDIVVDLEAGKLEAGKIDRLAAELSPEFYADPVLIRECFARGRAANLIHIDSGWKFDLFPLQADAYSLTEFGRRSLREVRPDGREGVECAVASVEDTVLRKLQWYRAGGEASARQWNDLLGVCRVAGTRLDFDYLAKWAAEIGVADLLERLLHEAA